MVPAWLIAFLIVMLVVAGALVVFPGVFDKIVSNAGSSIGGLSGHQQTYSGFHAFIIEYSDLQTRPNYTTALKVINGTNSSYTYARSGNSTYNATVKGNGTVAVYVYIPYIYVSVYGPDFFNRVTDVITLIPVPGGGFYYKPGNYSLAYFLFPNGTKQSTYPTLSQYQSAGKSAGSIDAVYTVHITAGNITYSGPLTIAVDACYRDPYSAPIC